MCLNRRKNSKARSLVSYLRWYVVVILVIILLAMISIMARLLFDYMASYTDFDIIIKPIPYLPNFGGLSYSGQEELFSLPNAATNVFWNANAKLTAILTMILSCIYPFFVGILLLHVFLIKSFQKYRIRSHSIFLLTQFSKLMMLSSLTILWLGLATSIDVEGINYEYWIKSGPTDQILYYFIICSAFITNSFILLIFDQWTYTQPKGAIPNNISGYKPIEADINNLSSINKKKYKIKKRENSQISTEYSVNKPSKLVSISKVTSFQSVDSDDKWYCLALNELCLPSSWGGIVAHSLFLVVLVAAVWIILESLYIKHVGFNFSGLTGLSLAQHQTYAISDVGDALEHGLHLKTFMGKGIPFVFNVFVFYLPICIQGLTLFIWFVPLKKMYLKWIVRWLMFLTGITVYDTYVVAVFLNTEMKQLSSYITNEIALPFLCSPSTQIGHYINEFIPGGCFTAEAFYLPYGCVLIVTAVILQWFTLGVTIYYVKKRMNVHPIRFYR